MHHKLEDEIFVSDIQNIDKLISVTPQNLPKFCSHKRHAYNKQVMFEHDTTQKKLKSTLDVTRKVHGEIREVLRQNV